LFFFFQAEDGIRDKLVTGVQTCALPISDQREIVVERAIPTPALPRHGPAGAPTLHFHFRFMNGPRRHRLSAGLVLRDHGLQHDRSEEHTSELQSLAYLVCRLLLEKKKKK